jgi:hypothetical protein
MYWRASKYVEAGEPNAGLRWFKAAELVIGHNEVLTRQDIESWGTLWAGIADGIVDRVRLLSRVTCEQFIIA